MKIAGNNFQCNLVLDARTCVLAKEMDEAVYCFMTLNVYDPTSSACPFVPLLLETLILIKQM